MKLTEVKNIICVIECDNENFRKNGNLPLSYVKYKPGTKYLCYSSDRPNSHIYRNGSDYSGYISNEFIEQNFVLESEYAAIDLLFEKNFYGN